MEYKLTWGLGHKFTAVSSQRQIMDDLLLLCLLLRFQNLEHQEAGAQ